MKPNKGIFQDAEYDDQPPGSWRTAKNVVPDGPNVVRNEAGFKEVTGMPTGKVLLGQIALPDDRIVVFLIGDPAVDSTTREIGIIDGTTYTKLNDSATIFSDWDINYPISGSHIVNSEGETIVAYTDNNSTPGLINIGTGEAELNISFKNEVRLFPETKVPNVFIDSVLNGGSLETGVYYFFFSYEAADGSTTNWMLPTNPVTITGSSYFDDWNVIQGAEAGSPGGKVITLRLTNVDTTYSKIKMAVLKKIGGVVSAEDVSSFIINGLDSNLIVSYSGDEATDDLLVEELVSDFATYNRAKALKIFNDVLYLGNTKQDNVLNYQPYANNIVLGWSAEDQISMDSGRGSYKDPYTIYTKRSFEPGEVYAFYIRFLLKDGTSSPAFHIPGRPANHKWNDGTAQWETTVSDERAPLSEAEFVAISNRARFFHFNETATWDGSGTKTGGLGYWENLDEQYPGQGDHNEYIGEGYNDQLGGPAGQAARNLYTEDGGFIKHHKFPNLQKLSEWQIPIITDNQAPGTTGPSINYSNTTTVTQWTDGFFVPVAGAVPMNSNQGSAVLGELFYNSQSEDYALVDISYSFQINWNVDFGEEGNWNNRYRCTVFIGERTEGYSFFNNVNPLAWDAYVNGQTITTNGRDLYIADLFEVDDGTFFTGITRNLTAGTIGLKANEGIYLHVIHDDRIPEVTTFSEIGPEPEGEISVSVTAEGLEVGVVSGSQFGYPLGLIVKNVTIPVEIRNKVQGFDILYAEKTLGNSLNLGYSVIVEQNNPFGGGATVISDGEGFRLYPPDMLLFRPNNKPTHIQALLISKDSNGTAHFTTEWDNANASSYPTMSDPTQTDWSRPASNTELVSWESTTKHVVRKVSNPQYLQHDNTAGQVNNGFREACYYAEMVGELSTGATSARIMVGVMTFKTSLYNSLYEQTLVSTGHFFQVPDSDVQWLSSSLPQGSRTLYGGDKFLQKVAQRISTPTSTVRGNYNLPILIQEGKIQWMSIPMYTTMNYGLLHEGDEWYEKFYPATNRSIGVFMPTGFAVPENYNGDGNNHIQGSNANNAEDFEDKGHYLMTLPQYRAYNTDYTSINNVDQSGVPYDPSLTYVEENEALVARSLKTQSANPLANIRKFLANDIYEMPKDKGGVEIIESLGDTILIHMKHGLYRTVGKEIFTPSSTAEVVLGTGDIFEREPRLVTYSGPGGFTGTRSRFAAVSSRLGYFFVDDRQGKVFLLNDTLEELSAKGLRNFFRDYAKLSADEDNPYYGVGYTACYDRKYNRIILTKQDGSDSFTISYSGDVQGWYSFHDYTPKALFSSDAAYASGPTGNVFQMNDETTKGTYLDTTVYPSYIDAVFPFGLPGGVAARVRAFTWKTNVLDPSGINLRNATIDKVMVYNKHQNSGMIDLNTGPRLSPIPQDGAVAGNTRNIHNNWRFNKFRDISQKDENSVKPPFYELNLSTIQPTLEWHKRKRFVDSFVVLRMQADNEVGENGQNTVYLYNADVEVLPNIVR